MICCFTINLYPKALTTQATTSGYYPKVTIKYDCILNDILLFIQTEFDKNKVYVTFLYVTIPNEELAEEFATMFEEKLKDITVTTRIDNNVYNGSIIVNSRVHCMSKEYVQS